MFLRGASQRGLIARLQDEDSDGRLFNDVWDDPADTLGWGGGSNQGMPFDILNVGVHYAGDIGYDSSAAHGGDGDWDVVYAEDEFGGIIGTARANPLNENVNWADTKGLPIYSPHHAVNFCKRIL